MVLGQASRDICCEAVCHNKLWLPYVACASYRMQRQNSTPRGPGSTVPDRPRILIDARPLQGADAVRGIGSYVRGLLAGMIEVGFDRRAALLIDARRPAPPLPRPGFVAHRIPGRHPRPPRPPGEGAPPGRKLEP